MSTMWFFTINLLVKFERLLETYLSFSPKGFRSFVAAMPIWLKDKLFLKKTLKQELADVGGIDEAKLQRFEGRTGCPVLVNTSCARGPPIVCTPEDAYRCFMRTEMDYLVMENVLLDKKQQLPWKEASDWREEFALD